jgi:long-chain acyl-CoA synthetase
LAKVNTKGDIVTMQLETDRIDYGDLYLSRPWKKHYPKGLSADITISSKSLTQIFDEATEKWEDKVAIIFYGKKISYRELRDLADRFANALYGLGTKKGDCVAIALMNCPQFIVGYFGALKAGAIVTPINPISVPREIGRQLRDSNAKTIICQDILYEGVEKSEVKPERIIITRIDEYLPENERYFRERMLKSVYRGIGVPAIRISEKEHVYSFEDLLKKESPYPPDVAFDPKEDVAVLPYTGGTTAIPKAAMLTHYNLVASNMILQTFFSFSFLSDKNLMAGGEVTAAHLPFHHIMGQLAIMVRGLTQGDQLILFSTPDLEDVLSGIGKYGVTVFFTVPAMLAQMEDYDKTDEIDWTQIKLINCGADILPDRLAKRWGDRIGYTMQQGYGLTETTAAVINTPIGGGKFGSIGVPMINTYAAVIDPQTADFLPGGEIGELIVHCPHVMKGYWERPDETKDAFIELKGKKWYRTGDLVRMDDEGYFFYVERKKDLIKYKGHSIFAREIEEVLIAHPKVKEAAVVGIPDVKVGSRIKAVVVPKLGAQGRLEKEEILSYCKERLTAYKVPKLIEFRKEIPKTNVGKVSRKALREVGDASN